MLDVARFRADFPLLAQRENGHPLVYLDNAATTQKPQAVLDAITEYYRPPTPNFIAGPTTSRFPPPKRMRRRAPGWRDSSTPGHRRAWCSRAAPRRRSTWWPALTAAPTCAPATAWS